MRNLILFAILLVGKINAQTSFFISPQILFKGQLTSSSPSHFDNYEFNPSLNFHYRNNQLILPKKFSPLLLGLSFGLRVSNKFFFELGVNQDESVSGATVSFMNYEPVFGIYSDSQIKYIKGNSFGRYYCQASYLLNKKGVSNRIYFDLGLGLAFRSGGITLEKFDLENYNFTIDENNSQVAINSFVVKNNNKSFLFNFGFTDDIYYKGRNLISLSLFFSKSFSLLNTVGTEIIVNSDNENRKYNYSSYSKGSGIYFKISRRIQLYSFKQENNTKKRE